MVLEKLEQLNLQDNQESREHFLPNFHSTNSTLNMAARKAIDELPIEFNDLFARHRLDIGIYHDFKVKLTLIDESPVYSQNLPTPISLKEDISVEVASLHKYGIIPTLTFSKYASPIFAQRKQTANYVFL